MCARSPMDFGRDVFDLVFAQPTGQHCFCCDFNKHGQMCARSPMAFGRDVFDIVFAQPTEPSQLKSLKTQLLKMIYFSTYELPRQCFFLICFATPDLQNHMNRSQHETRPKN